MFSRSVPQHAAAPVFFTHGCLQFAQHLMIPFQFLTPLICLILPLILPLILILHLSILFVAIQRCLGSPLTPQTLCAAIQS